MKAKVAFIFLSPGAERDEHKSVVETPAIILTVVGVKDYDEAGVVAAELVEAGVTAIELCGGFGHEGVARVSKAIGRKAAVGAVRFDCHPGMGFKSGDDIFGEFAGK